MPPAPAGEVYLVRRGARRWPTPWRLCGPLFPGSPQGLLGAGLVLVLTFFVARLLQRLGARFLQRIGLDDLFERTGAASSLQHVDFGRRPSFVFGYVLFW